jgi:hypothetical protein
MKKNINDNTLVRVKVPKALYEAIQAKLAEKKMEEGTQEEGYGMHEAAVGEPGTQMAAEKMMHAISSGDPFTTGIVLVGAIVAGIVAGPKVIDTIKGYYKALTQKDPTKAEELKKAAEAAKVNISGINESNKRNKK